MDLSWLSRRRADLAALAMFLILIPLLIWVPTLFGHDPSAVSAAQAEGYSNRVAHIVAVLSLAACVVAVFFLTRGESQVSVPMASADRPSAFVTVIQALLVTLFVAFTYFPPALARFGPYLEEMIHLSAIHRMFTGDVPYRDFEFLYGPLMLYPAYFWMRLTGYSLVSFYSYVALLELSVFLILFYLVQRYITSFWPRLAAFVLMGSLLFNALLGPNQNGLRKILGVVILFGAASRPFSRGVWIASGIGVGALLSYSQEFGVATAIGIAAIYLAIFFKNRDKRALFALAATATISAVVWLGVTWALLGADFSSYFRSLAFLTRRFDAGEAAFRFYWTLSSLALFALLFLSAWQVGRVLKQPWNGTPSAAELIFIGGLAFSLVMLKSGLSRADQWHLVPSTLVLAFAFVLPVPARISPIGRGVRRIGVGLVVVIALAYSFGQYLPAQYIYRDGLYKGYRDVVRGQSALTPPTVKPVWPALVFQSYHPSDEAIDLSTFLSTPPWRERRVFIYGRGWGSSVILGVAKAGPLADDYIYSDARGTQAVDYLNSHPKTLVLISRSDFDWLRKGPNAPVPAQKLYLIGEGLSRRALAAISSPHVPDIGIEERLKQLRWRRLIGLYIAAHYRIIHESPKTYVLERIRETSSEGEP